MIELAYIAKWLHLCLVMVLMGGLLGNFALLAVALRSHCPVKRKPLLALSKVLDWAIAISMLLLALTGTVLVYPRGYTFSTPWIDAAYVFLALAGLGLWVSTRIRRRLYQGARGCSKGLFVYGLVVTVVFVTLIVIAYEAVSKQTFLF